MEQQGIKSPVRSWISLEKLTVAFAACQCQSDTVVRLGVHNLIEGKPLVLPSVSF